MWDSLLRKIPIYDPYKDSDDFYFDEKPALKAFDFFEHGLVHIKGDDAGDPFKLEDWQKAIIANLVGWKFKSNGLRRYLESFIFVPRKNGKTILSAGLALFFLFCDGEPGAEIYCAAKEREQASILFDYAKWMVEKNVTLTNNSRVYKKSIIIEKNHSVFKALSAEADTKHGYNPHVAIIDELHVQRDRDLFDTLQSGMGARSQPLLLSITTSDYERESICNEKYDYAKRIAEGSSTNPRFLPVIYEADRKDDWTSKETWKKANPNYGVSVREDFLEQECLKAQESPAYENTFKRLYLNIRTEQAERWIQMDDWKACGGKIDIDELRNVECWAGLDLSNTQDVTALVLLFKTEPIQIIPFFWIPKDFCHERELKHAVGYLTWERQGFIHLTPGNVVDYAFIRKKINDLSEIYKIKEIAFDPWNATQLAVQLQEEDGIEMIEFRQGFKSMNEPCKNLEILLKSRRLNHGNNPVLKWMASNVATATDPAGNIKLDKKKSFEKIDGIAALVMAIGRAISVVEKKQSIYETGEGIWFPDLET